MSAVAQRDASSAANPVERLRRLDVRAVSDALDRLGLSGLVDGLARLATRRRIPASSRRSGACRTAKRSGMEDRGTRTSAIAAAGPEHVVVARRAFKYHQLQTRATR